MDKLEIYFIRHGETEWNKEERLQGWLDSPLTKEGRESVKALSTQLRKLQFNTVYTSPLGRAIETTRILTNNHFIVDSRLQEIQLGKWQGCLIPSLLQKDVSYITYINNPECYQPNESETFEEVSNRMIDFLFNCCSQHKNGAVLVVTHGVAIRCLLLKLLNLPVDSIWELGDIQSASVTKITAINHDIKVDFIGRVTDDDSPLF